ncbi:DoxX family protein [Mycobacterium sp.]|uniref:DoxX family protein n=1 Tax=Mycobacterium sp. TaxID=1785 RepID=UPI002D581E25|nr:DoxX family protein [Mycobacterium sp.]HZA10968.1 DoxX family protein [Mycobacterium sp.]
MTSHPDDPRTWQRPDDTSTVRPGSASLVDPEDDLPSANYAGDFTTTAIPRYNSGNQTSSSSGLGLLGEPEPLPYVQSGPGRHAAVGPEEVGPDEIVDERVRAAGRRGTQDLGLLLLRVGVGAVLVAHGVQKAFGLWGGQGLAGFGNSLSDAGYQHAGMLSYLAAGTQIAAGVLLVLGLFTPLAGAAALAYLTNALLANVAAQHRSGRLSFFLPDGIEYQVVLIVAVAAVILAGPGRIGFDVGRGWARRPFLGCLAALLIGIGGGVGAWMLLNGANPIG